MKYILILIGLCLVFCRKKYANIEWHTDEERFDFPETAQVQENKGLVSQIVEPDEIKIKYSRNKPTIISKELYERTYDAPQIINDYHIITDNIGAVKSNRSNPVTIKQKPINKTVKKPTIKKSTIKRPVIKQPVFYSPPYRPKGFQPPVKVMTTNKSKNINLIKQVGKPVLTDSFDEPYLHPKRVSVKNRKFLSKRKF